MSLLYLSLSFRATSSRLFDLDPRLRLALGFGPLLLSLLGASFSLTVASLLLALGLAAIAGCARRLVRAQRYMALLALLLSGLSYVSGMALTPAIGQGLRLLAFFSSSSLTLMLVAPEEIEPLLAQARLPQGFILVFMGALRLAPQLALEYQNIVDAQRARGVEHGARSPVARLRGLALVLVPLTALALRTALDLAQALEIRGYGAAKMSRPPPGFKWGRRESLILLVYLLGLAALLLLLPAKALS